MNAEDIRGFLRSIRSQLELKGKEVFNPRENHIELSYGIARYNGPDKPSFFAINPLGYMEYDEYAKKTTGINPQLAPMLDRFLKWKKRDDLAREIREAFQDVMF